MMYMIDPRRMISNRGTSGTKIDFQSMRYEDLLVLGAIQRLDIESAGATNWRQYSIDWQSTWVLTGNWLPSSENVQSNLDEHEKSLRRSENMQLSSVGRGLPAAEASHVAGPRMGIGRLTWRDKI